LKILDQGNLQAILVRGIAINDGHRFQPGQRRSPPAAFPRQDLQLFPVRGNDNRLNDSMLPYGICQFRQGFLRTAVARLETPRHEPANLDFLRSSNPWRLPWTGQKR
jgi:hypothetical protein